MKKISIFIRNLILWLPLLVSMEYHDSNEEFVSIFFALAIVLPIAIPRLIIEIININNQNNFTFSAIEYILVSFVTYISIGLIANLCAKDFFGDGFL